MTAAATGCAEFRDAATPERLIPCIALVPREAVKPEMPASGPTAPPNMMGRANRTSDHGQFFTL